VEIFLLTPRFNAVVAGPVKRKTVSNGFSLGLLFHPAEAGR
jgi:hypothetical protein